MQAEGSVASGVVSLLEARGERKLGALVDRSGVEIVGAPSRWTMGAREVSAYRVALVVSAEDHVLLSRSPSMLELIREAFVTAVHTATTELESLHVVLALPPSALGFHQTYREAPPRAPDPPLAQDVLGGAIRLLVALGEKVLAEVLSRAVIEDEFVDFGPRRLRRFLLRLDPADLARVQRDVALSDRLMQVLRDAATTTGDLTNAVSFGVRLYGGADAPLGVEARLVAALERKGVAVVPVSRGEGKTVLALVVGGVLSVLEVLEGSKAGAMATMSSGAKVMSFMVGARGLSGDEEVEQAAATFYRLAVSGRGA